jgi:hypothetical protein
VKASDDTGVGAGAHAVSAQQENHDPGKAKLRVRISQIINRRAGRCIKICCMRQQRITDAEYMGDNERQKYRGQRHD